jgi:hypothetical protein
MVTQNHIRLLPGHSNDEAYQDIQGIVNPVYKKADGKVALENIFIDLPILVSE